MKGKGSDPPGSEKWEKKRKEKTTFHVPGFDFEFWQVVFKSLACGLGLIGSWNHVCKSHHLYRIPICFAFSLIGWWHMHAVDALFLSLSLPCWTGVTGMNIIFLQIRGSPLIYVPSFSPNRIRSCCTLLIFVSWPCPKSLHWSV